MQIKIYKYPNLFLSFLLAVFVTISNASSAKVIPVEKLAIGGPNSNITLNPNNLTFSSSFNKAKLPGCLLAVRTQVSGSNRTFLLSSSLYPKIDSCNFSPGSNLFPDSVTRPDASELGVESSILIFTPLIPQELTQYPSPGFCVVWRLRNSKPVPVTVSILVSWQPQLNHTPISTASLDSENGEFGESLANSGYSGVLACAPERSDQTVTETSWNTDTSLPSWYSTFKDHGDLKSTSKSDTNNAAAVCVKFILKPGENTDIPFSIVWSKTDNIHFAPSKIVQASTDRLLAEWLPLHILTDEWQHKIQFSNLPNTIQHHAIFAVENLFTSFRINSSGSLVIKKEDGKINTCNLFLSYPLLEFFSPLSAEKMAKTESDPVLKSFMLLEQCMWAGNTHLLISNISPTVKGVIQSTDGVPESKWLALQALLTSLQYLPSSDDVSKLRQQLNLSLSALPRLATPLSSSCVWIAKRLGIPVTATNSELVSNSHPSDADILEMFSVAPQEGINGLQAAIQKQIPASGTNLNTSAFWNIPITMAGLHLNLPEDSASIFPSIPGEWRVLDCPIFAPTFIGWIHYAPGIHGPQIELNIDNVLPRSSGADISHIFSHTAAFSLKTLWIPGPLLKSDSASSTFSVYISLNHHPLSFKFKLMLNNTVCITFSAPVSLSAGDILKIREQ